ncbi:UPF0193 protein EVG1 homolog [Hyposmocoma kahamanoa]|uniref:UPF0193 protein EVG1 homolog n=1 Tax=Hyposmocoma kahamanoa TaxID=1477025 RepID=UPI000E6D75E9|nr:UPF0193 protein EVG1 homolog [Hyposmocoma kahamanoa]
MQEPDVNGFVNIQWPSKNVPHGGIFHPKRAELSEKQQNFLKVLLEESRLTLAQRKKSGFKLREETQPARTPSEAQIFHYNVPKVRPRTSKRRSLSAIRASGIYETDEYRPLKRGEDREKLKDKLANAMAYNGSEDLNVPVPPVRLLKPEPKLPTKKDLWHDLISQIRERAEWIAEMEDLGHAAPHREIIREQIAERVRALDALGVDSECGSVKSGFSTLRSREEVDDTVRSKDSAKSGKSTKSKASVGMSNGSTKSDHSRRSTDSQRKAKSSIRSRIKKEDENVAAYDHLSPLQHSPRRRV